MTYQINSMLVLPEKAWTYELTGSCRTTGAVAGLAVLTPDAPSDGEQFTPSQAAHAHVAAAATTAGVVRDLAL